MSVSSNAGGTPRPDRENIGLPEQCNDLIKELVAETPWFKEEVDAYRLAITLALAKDLKPGSREKETYVTKFHVRTVDPDDKLAELVGAMAPDHAERPYDWAQRLANKGVHYLHNELVVKGRPIGQVLDVNTPGVG